MDKVFDFVEGEARLKKDELSLIPEFKALLAINYNKQVGDTDGRKRHRATKEFTYIWFMYASKSPYREYNAKEKEEELLRMLSIGPKDISPELQAAIDKYKELNHGRVLRLIMSAEGAVDKLRGYYDTLDFTNTTAAGALVNKPTDVINSIYNLDKVVSALSKLTDRQKNEEGKVVSSRGEQEPGWVMEEDEEENYGD